MIASPSRARLVTARSIDALALVLFGVFVWRVWFGTDELFDGWAIAVAVVAIVAAAAARGPVRMVVDGPLSSSLRWRRAVMAGSLARGEERRARPRCSPRYAQ